MKNLLIIIVLFLNFNNLFAQTNPCNYDELISKYYTEQEIEDFEAQIPNCGEATPTTDKFIPIVIHVLYKSENFRRCNGYSYKL